ncbi:hypothetical protein ASPFODRAFT_293340 [Aspergillus luchuensis CBS 106.47]|uniref:C2H2-type domain-containing protein n=1 Tax=Aspergillus luchuensis (strain CBS 106.47) TaxID=1137211 RepID=A0A1M3TAW5_ASPLC|nr:hypothetical protein ASPFODRAFT_293340 [Aspergillus luchuensis CBS 106.47]
MMLMMMMMMMMCSLQGIQIAKLFHYWCSSLYVAYLLDVELTVFFLSFFLSFLTPSVPFCVLCNLSMLRFVSLAALHCKRHFQSCKKLNLAA